jgi:hypothetical protein
MDRNRRRALQAVGLAGATAALSGCLVENDSATDGADSDDENDETGEFTRVDQPPYGITEPPCPGSGEERNALWLCANMPAEPSLPFEQAQTSGMVFRDEGLQYNGDILDSQFYATLLTDPDDLDRVDRTRNSSPAALIEGTNFGSQAVLVAQTGWGSGTVTPHLKRIESTATGIHAFGCYFSPCAGTDDVTQRTVFARFPRSEPLDSATVSLTVDPGTRVHFRSGEGVVTVEG